MKKVIILLFICLTVSIGTARGDDMYVVVAGPSTGTRINTLPYTISEPGFYYLGDNLSSSGDGIIIETSDVTLDLMGYKISGSSEEDDGISSAGGRENLVIRNGSIKGFRNGIFCIGKGIRVLHVTVRSVGQWGIALEGQGNAVKDCQASDCASIGIWLCGPGRVEDCSVYLSEGMGVLAQKGCTVIGNRSRLNGKDGIRITKTGPGNDEDGFLIKDNVCNRNGDSGINAPGADTLIINNVCAGNGLYGISAGGLALVQENVCTDNEFGDIKTPAGTYSNTDEDGVNFTGANTPAP